MEHERIICFVDGFNMYHAFLLSRDSDLAPAVRKVKQNFPDKKITVLSPYNYRHSSELIQVCDRYKTIDLQHISTSLFPEMIYDDGGNLIARRPQEYAPPTELLKKLITEPILNH